MLSCKEASDLASKGLDHRLSWRESLGLKMHLLFCRLCRRYLRDLRFMRRALKKAGEDDLLKTNSSRKISGIARERIRKALSEAHQDN